MQKETRWALLAMLLDFRYAETEPDCHPFAVRSSRAGREPDAEQRSCKCRSYTRPRSWRAFRRDAGAARCDHGCCGSRGRCNHADSRRRPAEGGRWPGANRRHRDFSARKAKHRQRLRRMVQPERQWRDDRYDMAGRGGVAEGAGRHYEYAQRGAWCAIPSLRGLCDRN